MITAIFSFLGGSVFRMVWGEVSSFFKARQDHAQEMDRSKLQGELEQLRHSRDLELMSRSHELGIQRVQIESDATVQEEEAKAFTTVMKSFSNPTGISWVDAWNASIRPLFATACFALWMMNLYTKGWMTDDFDRHLIAVIVGFFFADRTLKKYGK